MTHLILLLTLFMQTPPGVPVVDEVERARSLANQGQWDRAVELLMKARQRCAARPEGDECLSRAIFTLGYVDAARAEAEPAIRNSALARAAEAYAEVEAIRPGDAQVLNNLALVLAARGDWSGAVDKLGRAAGTDPAQKGSYYLEAAEVCRDANRMTEAAGWYRRAAENGEGDRSWPRLISLLGAQMEGTEPNARIVLSKTLLKLGMSLTDLGRSELAADAYEQVIEHSIAKVPGLAEEALVRWVSLRGEAGAIDADTLKHLDAVRDWKSASISQLVALSQNPGAERTSWNATQLQRHAWAAAATSLAAGFVKTNPKTALVLYERALEAAPMPPEYDFDPSLAQRPIVFLEAAMQIARLLSAQKSLDPDGSRFRRLEETLFNGKALGYKMKNLAATQKTHAVLGVIYAERGKWTGGQYTNATYQLSQALSEAAEREKSEGILLPLPHLNEALAGAYASQGKSQDARDQFAAAAKSYLDLDAVDQASRVIERATTLNAGLPPGQAKADLETLRSITEFRRKIPSLTANSVQNEKPPELTSSDAGFLARQRFKMLADLAERVGAVGNPEVSHQLYLRALDSVREQDNLAGTGDVRRLDRIQSSVQKRVHVDTKKSGDGGSADLSPAKVWKLPESTTSAAAPRIAWSTDLLLAAKVAAVAPATDVSVSVKNAAIVVEASPQNSTIAKSAADRLTAAGLANVTTSTKNKAKTAVVTPP
jgi:tetratricopeptide (TPR) repeat protein